MNNLNQIAKHKYLFSIDDENLLSTDIALIKWFNDRKGLVGLLTEENYKVPSEYMRTEYHQLERTFKRYYE